MNPELLGRIQLAKEEFSQGLEIVIQKSDLEYSWDGNTYSLEKPVSYSFTREVDIQSLDEEWLRTDATKEERDQTLEAWITSYYYHFLSPENSPIAAAYGIQEPLNPRTARLMAYTALTQEYIQRIDRRQELISQSEGERIKRRNDINEAVRRKTIKAGRGQKEREAVDNKHNEYVSPHIEEIANCQAIESFITGKFIYETFSPMPLENDAAMNPDSFQQSLHDINTIPNASSAVARFLGTQAERLIEKENAPLFRDYRYKQTERLSRNMEDCNVPLKVLQFAIRDMGMNEELGFQIKNLGESFLIMLSQQAIEQSEKTAQFTEKRPLLTLFYDIVNASLIGTDIGLRRDTLGVLLEETMGGSLRSYAIKNEVKSLVDSYQKRAEVMFRLYPSYLTSQRRFQFDLLPTELKEFMVSDTRRLFDSLKSSVGITFSTGDHNGPFVASPSIESFVTNTKKQINMNQDARMYWRELERALPMSSSLYRFFDISVDLTNSLAAIHLGPSLIERAEQYLLNPSVPEEQRVVLETALQQTRPQTGTFRQRAAEVYRSIETGVTSGVFPVTAMTDFEFLEEYSHFHLSTPHNRLSHEVLQHMHHETRELWFHVLNTSKWFISPRGDSYHGEDDPELQENEIESITFGVDTRFPREHKVMVQLAGMEHPIELWLDTHERLLDQDHRVPALDGSFTLALTNLILKRLCYITSGVLAQNPRRREYERPSLGGPNFTWRRANYHVLEDPRYTMTSAGVNPHAEAILAKYGIDIFAERDRRRRLGVIGPRTHITFNDEVIPDVVPDNPPPNIIIYKPEDLMRYLQQNRYPMMQ